MQTGPMGRRVLLRVVGGAVVLLLAVLVWANVQGYVPGPGTGCSDVGYPDPQPTYDELVSDHGESPYCARRVLGQTWW